MRVEWQRDEPRPPADATPDAAALTEALRAEIGRGGPITFARFMESALYDPGHGYYATATTRTTRAGDFLTAPELHPIFGQTLAGQVAEMWQRLGAPDPLTLREYGAGSGALAVALLDGLDRLHSPLATTVRYEPVDFARQRVAIRDRMAEAGRESQVVLAAQSHDPFEGVVIANEFIDALPVHRVIRLNGELREIHVDWRDDQFAEVAGPLTDDRLAAWFDKSGIELVENQRAEVNLAMLDWLSDLASQLERGYVLVIDYGASAANLYGPERAAGTIRAFSEQRVSSDVLSAPGTRDITSHVDFDVLERNARACGFKIAGRRRANEFLIAAGLDDAYTAARAATENDWDAALTLRSAITRLLDPNALGGYLVSVLAKDAPVDPPLSGFAEIPRAT